MPFFKKTIFTGFAPNLMKDDLTLALKYMFFPPAWSGWKVGEWPVAVEEWLKKYFATPYALTFDSGRSAITLALKAMGISPGDEVICQAYTCLVVVNAVKQAGAIPVYVDIDSSFNMDTADLRKKISAKTKVIIVQHTFGLPARVDAILEQARQGNIKVLEDCAHCLGAEYRGRKLGTYGDAAIFSFGSDKAVSSVRGGAVITNDAAIFSRLKNYQARLPSLPAIKIWQHLMSYPVWAFGKWLYSFFIGKFILQIAKKIYLIPRVVSNEEKRGKQPIYYPAKLANCLAELASQQLNKLELLNAHRRMLSLLYQEKIKLPKLIKPVLTEGAVCLRFPLLTDQPDILRARAKSNNIILGDWYNSVISPPDIDWEATGYTAGSCPTAENMAKRSVNLPTDINVSAKDAARIIEVINNY